MNRTIKLLMISDIFVITGFGLIDPILAIFIKDNLIGGTIFSAGLASTLFLITKSIIQLPFSRYVDSHDDKVKWLIIGTFFIALVPFIYIFANNISLIYLAQALHGIGAALAFPTWLSLWSIHLDKKHEGFEWSVYSTFTGLGTATAAAIGAAIAQFVGFKFSFIIVGLSSLAGCAILFGLEKKQHKLEKIDVKQYHTKRKLINKRHH